MKFSVGDKIKIKDPVPTPGGKWGMSGKHGTVIATYPFKLAIDDVSDATEPEYHYDLALWWHYKPDLKIEEGSVRESYIEPCDE